MVYVFETFGVFALTYGCFLLAALSNDGKVMLGFMGTYAALCWIFLGYLS